MALSPGARLGSYTIAAKVGAGGMGEVYRATDTRLNRQVAIKVLPAEVTQDPDRLGRFQREAQVLASLNHPGIAAIYGLDEADGQPFLVMELVEGEDLAERLKRGPIPVDEALDLARQMAAALEAAHEKGIVHRDLKPANLMLTEDGKLKILDFGLAKAYGLDGTGRSGPDLAHSPTITEMGTVAGMILGTAAYMSPEQARGKALDKRADIWAFGVVLHEMLTGKQLFAGETVSDTLAAVLTREPDLQALPSGVPPRVRSLLARCLRKDARERLRDIGDARLELQEPVIAEPATQALAVRPRSPAWIFILAAAAVVAALAGGVLYGRRSAVTELPTYRQLTFGRGYVYTARFAPDGQTVVYGGAFEERPVHLYTTRTDGHDSRPMDLPSADVAGIAKDGRMALLLGRHYAGNWSSRVGTLAQVSLSGGAPREILEEVLDADISPDGERFAVVLDDKGQRVLQYPIGKELFRTEGWIGEPRISPDGRSVAFVHHRLFGDDLGEPALVREGEKMVPLGPEAQYAHGLCWSADGRDVWFSMGEVVRGGEVWAVAASGGAPRLVLRTPTTVRLLDIAADGRLLLATDETRASVAGMLAGDTTERLYSWWDQDTVEGISDDGTTYAGDNPSTQVNGEYAVYVRRGTEPPVQVAMGTTAGLTPDGKFVAVADVSKEQTRIVLQPAGPGQPREISLGGVHMGGGAVSFSRDGRRIAFPGRVPGGDPMAYVQDLAGGPPRSVGPSGSIVPRISPDGSKVAVTIVGGGSYVVSAAGGERQLIPGLPKGHLIRAWTSDGTAVLSWDLTFPPRVFRTPIAGGSPELVREIALPDPAGVIYGRLVLSPDARYHLVRYRRVLSSVSVVSSVTGTKKN